MLSDFHEIDQLGLSIDKRVDAFEFEDLEPIDIVENNLCIFFDLLFDHFDELLGCREQGNVVKRDFELLLVEISHRSLTVLLFWELLQIKQVYLLLLI